ncbi:hypothetical protein MMC24_002569 [Lignoscripta atroalba]|nr:hypothetical protein [Lignoscripta atroalba]
MVLYEPFVRAVCLYDPPSNPLNGPVCSQRHTDVFSQSLKAFNCHEVPLKPGKAEEQRPLPSEKSQSRSLSDEVRMAMRKVPHPLMVVLAKNKDDVLAGLLVSSFNTVTLHPHPIVSFNLKLPSSTFDAIQTSLQFTVYSVSSIATAKTFVKGEWPKDKDRRDWVGSIGATDNKELLPGTIFKMSCEWLKEKSVQVGDHIIMIGRVLRLEGAGSSGKSHPQLIYSEGQYRNAGKPLEGDDGDESRT